MSGVTMSSTRDSGERAHMSMRSSSISGSPTNRYQVLLRNGRQYSGNERMSVTRLDGPTKLTAARKRSGVKVTPTSVA